jgi:hypothetical protein
MVVALGERRLTKEWDRLRKMYGGGESAACKRLRMDLLSVSHLKIHLWATSSLTCKYWYLLVKRSKILPLTATYWDKLDFILLILGLTWRNEVCREFSHKNSGRKEDLAALDRALAPLPKRCRQPSRWRRRSGHGKRISSQIHYSYM